MLRGINPKETKSNLEKIIQQTQKKKKKPVGLWHWTLNRDQGHLRSIRALELESD